MSRTPIVAALAVVVLGGPARAQTIPEGSQASKVQQSYRRTPSFRNDPFRHVAIPHWGFVISTGASGGNNAINASDVGALIVLKCGPNSIEPLKLKFSCNGPDSLKASDVVDAIGLVPRGSGLRAFGQGEGAVYLGGPFGSHVSVGLSARGTGYGAAQLDDGVVSLLRDGNGTGQTFSLGATRAIALGTAEAGAHAVLRFGPMGSPDGVKVHLGFGLRLLRPVGFVRVRSLIPGGGTIRVTPDSVAANVSFEQAMTMDSTFPGESFKTGRGKAADFLLRLEWPTSGFALEAMVSGVGSVTVPQVETSRASLNLASTNLKAVSDSIDNVQFIIQDTVSLKVTLPRTVRFTASGWANRILQIDLSATLPVTGDFESPLAVDMGTTWRFIRTLPLRAGMSVGGTEGIGFSGGFAIEGRTMFLQVGGQSLGGLLRQAKGIGVRMELGLFF